MLLFVRECRDIKYHWTNRREKNAPDHTQCTVLAGATTTRPQSAMAIVARFNTEPANVCGKLRRQDERRSLLSGRAMCGQRRIIAFRS